MRPASGIRVGFAGRRKGRGVFATKHFLPGDLIERAPLIEIDQSDVAVLIDSIVESYWYEMDDGGTAIGLGFTSLYNHSYRANAVYEASSSDHIVYIVAHREIKPGAEITINYNGDPDCKTKVMFNKSADKSEEKDPFDPDVHYLEKGEWESDGWAWCGACDVKSTTEPSLVSCRLCRLRMMDERRALLSWNPDEHDPIDGKEFSRMMEHTIERLSRDGHAIYADIVREALSRLKEKKDG